MKVKDNIALHLRCIEADLREYLMDPSDHTFETIEDVHILLLDVMIGWASRPNQKKESQMMTRWEKFERVVLLLLVIVLIGDLLYWRPY